MGSQKWSEMGVVSSQFPSLLLAEVPGTLKLPRQGHSWQRLSDCPNTFLGRGNIPHLCWGLGVAEDSILEMKEDILDKYSNYKNNHHFSGWISLLRPQVPQTPFLTHFHCSLFMLCDDRSDLSFSYCPSSATEKPKMMSFTSSAKNHRLKIYCIQIHVVKLKPPLFSWRSFGLKN